MPSCVIMFVLLMALDASCSSAPAIKPSAGHQDAYRSYSVRKLTKMILPYLSVATDKPLLALVKPATVERKDKSPPMRHMSKLLERKEDDELFDLGVKDFDEFEKKTEKMGPDYGHLRFGRGGDDLDVRSKYAQPGPDYGHLRFG